MNKQRLGNDYFHLVALLFLLLLFGYVQPKRNYEVHLQEFKCTKVATKIIERFDCFFFKQPDKYVYTLRIELKLFENINSCDIKIMFDMLRKDNSKMNFLNTHVDGCKFLSSFSSSNMLRMGQQDLRKHSNLPEHCPILANRTYLLNNYTINAQSFPPILSQATVQFRASVLHNAEIYIDAYFKGSIVYQKV